MKGLRVACLYSVGCPELKRMKAKKKQIIYDFLRNPKGDKSPSVKEILEKLEPFLFYKLISFQNDITDPFNEDIVRSYWLGNPLLKPIAKENVARLLFSEESQEHHQLRLMKILNLVGGKPHHNFETLWLIKGIKAGRGFPLKFLGNLNNCLVRAGKVIYTGKLISEVKTKSIVFQNRKITLEDSIESLQGSFVKNLEEEDFISIHLGMAREKIQRETAENLLKITEEAISFFKGAK